jgi:hypothetical protein
MTLGFVVVPLALSLTSFESDRDRTIAGANDQTLQPQEAVAT